jgi:hypothetical protein
VTITSGSVTATISGTVTVSVSGTANVNISSQTGNLNVNIAASAATLTVSGSVSITGTPSVTIASGTVSISGTVDVSITTGSVSITSGSITIIDPEDVWGNTHSLGLAELAARLGSIDTFDRRGNVLWMDDFENGIEEWIADNGSNFAWSSSRHRTGGFCAKMWTASITDSHNTMGTYIPFSVISKMGFEFSFIRDENLKVIYLEIWFLSGSTRTDVEVRWTAATQTWAYWGADELWHDLSPTMNFFEDFPVHIVKLVADFVNSKYVRLIADNVVYDMTNVGAYNAATSVGPYVVTPYIRIENNPDVSTTVYVDDVIVTQNET